MISTHSLLKKILKLSTLILCVTGLQSYAQTTVNSLTALLPYLDDNNADVKLAPGTYNVTVNNIDDYLSTVPFDGDSLKSMLLFSGNNSTYDFTGVTINVETGIFQSVGNFEFFEVHVIGNNNVLKNLTLVDVGSKDDHPRGGTVNLVMDGKSNRFEGFHVTSTGSKPYGYGDSFGKGGTNNVIAHKKHSTFLVRGEYNHALNCTLIHRTYGHCIFMQAASYPTIEGCYVEGELRSTDDMLAEEGTGSAADDVDFRTTWGYRLPAGFMMSTGEEGIRAYNGGRTIIDGEVFGPMAANNVTVKNCTIKYMRGGVTIAHASGSRYVEGCTAIGCEQGFSVGGGGNIVDCYADAAYGPVFKSTYNSDRNTSVDITIIPPEDGYYNGSKQIAYIGGSGHDVVLKTTDPNMNPDLKILMGGDNYSVRVQDTSGSQTDHYATNVTIENYTGYTIELPNDSSGNEVTTCGEVIDNGSNNAISNTENCEEVVEVDDCENTTAHIEAECFDMMMGIQTEASDEGTDNVGWIQDGDWMAYEAIDLTGMQSINVRVASGSAGGTIEVRTGSSTGTLISTVTVTSTGNFQAWKTVSASISATQGVQDVYLVCTGGTGYLFNVNYLGFSADATLSVFANDLGKTNMVIFPNPVVETATIKNAEAAILNVYSMSGVKVLNTSIKSANETISLNALNAGVYYMELTKNQVKSIVKVIKK